MSPAHLHAVHVDASADTVLLANQTQLGDAVEQAVIELRREKRDRTCLLPGGQCGSRTDGWTEQRTARYQDEVSVLCGPVLVGQFQDVSLLNELVSWVDDVFFAAQQLVHLQQLLHPLLRDRQTDRHLFQYIYYSLSFMQETEQTLFKDKLIGVLA